MMLFEKKLPLLLAVLGSLILCLIVMQGAQAMGLFAKKEPAYPFSGFSGQLLYQGKPSAHAKITRSYELLEKKFEETLEADAEGRFSFESIVIDYKAPLLSALEFMSHQEIFVVYQGNRFQIWGGSKTEKDEFAEFGGYRPLNLVCEITDEIHTVSSEIGFIGTNCYWDVKKNN